VFVVLKEEEAQITGIVLVTDFKSFGWKQARRLKPLYAKHMVRTLQVLLAFSCFFFY